MRANDHRFLANTSDSRADPRDTSFWKKEYMDPRHLAACIAALGIDITSVNALFPGDTPVVISNGMGADSAALIAVLAVCCAADPALAARITLVSAQLGSESAATRHYNERYVLPLLAAAGMRYVQIARAGPSYHDRYMVLDDSTAPTTLSTRSTAALPYFTLADELRQAGTCPQYAQGKRVCSDKFKGQTITWFLHDLLGARPFIYVFGYAAEEGKRIRTALAHEDTRGLAETYCLGDRPRCRARVHPCTVERSGTPVVLRFLSVCGELRQLAGAARPLAR